MSQIERLSTSLRDAAVRIARRIDRRRTGAAPGRLEHICVFSGLQNPGLGDLVRRNHLYWAIRAARPDARLTLIESQYIVKRFREFYANHAHLDNIMTWPDPGTISRIGHWRRVLGLRAQRFDTCIIDPLSTSFRPMDAALAGVRNVVALPSEAWSPQEAHIVNRPLRSEYESEPDLFDMAAALGQALGCPGAVARDAFPPRFPLRLDESNPLETARLLVAIHAGGERRWPRRWPLNNYSELCRHLAADAGVAIVLVGGAEERTDAEAIKAAVAAECPAAVVLNACGNNCNDLAATIDQASLFVGNDSAPLHLAGALGTPCVAILGPSQQIDPIVRGVYRNYQAVIGDCHCVQLGNHQEFPCDQYHPAGTGSRDDRYPHCLAGIPVERVARAVDSMLTQIAGQRRDVN